MLKLKRVEIHGFKSFYDRTEMKFNGTGIAAVVGPNGCGKSNLSDAISWVLGEQSAKSLRGSRMEDVIFAGTRDKKALGMATVTMTLVPDERVAIPHRIIPENPSPAVTLDPAEEMAHATNGNGLNGTNGYGHTNGHGEHAPIKSDAAKTAERTGEITITRRLYRSGESEYLINGKAARLRDIQDLFLGTGLGPESYAIIEQGRIGQILSNKPQDRRNVIEEAAGITKFRTRKRLAEAKLESAKQNLSRVFDILEEVNRQVNSLKRQAAKTKRYTELKGEAVAFLLQILATKFCLLEREAAKIVIELNLASGELQTAQNAIADGEKTQSGVLETSYATERELTETRKALADLQLEAERARGRLEYQIRQVEQIDQRLRTGEQDALRLEAQHQERAAELEQLSQQVGVIDLECAGARSALEEKSAQRQQAQNNLAEQERNLESIRQRVLRLLGDSSTLKNRIAQTEEKLASSDRDAVRAQAEEQQSNSDLARIERLKADLSERLSARQLELHSVADQRQTVQQELQQRRSALGEKRKVVEHLRGEFSRAKARKDSLEEVMQHRSYTTETVKRLFTAVESGKAHDLRPVGVLADFLEVDPQFEKAAEEFLHDELEYVVVRNWQDAERGIELMRTDLNGRATFLVEGPETDEAAGAQGPDAKDGVAKFSDALRLTNGLASLPLRFLPRIANCWVTPDRDTARELAAQYPDCWFLSNDGVNYHGRSISGGKKTGAGPLALKRELREVSLIAAAKQKELAAALNDVTELERAISGLEEQLEMLRAKQQAQEKDVLALDHESRKSAEELQRVQSRLSRARLELDRLSRDRVTLQEQFQRDQAALAQAEQARTEQEQQLESAREALTGLQREVAIKAEEHAALRANLASLEERRRSLAGHQARIDAQVKDLTSRRTNLVFEMERLSVERAQFLSGNSELEAEIERLKQAIQATQVQVAAIAERESELRNQLAAIDEELKNLRSTAEVLHERRSESQIALARTESELKHLEETCQKELETSLHQLAESTETIADSTALAEMDGQYLEVRRKIEALGPVNAQALEEFEEAQQRQEFLIAQRQDLLDSIRDTEKAIQDLEGESRKRFSEAFHAINANFREMFKTLFGGGTGEMRLTDEENLAESGIDIVASPPGKRLQSVVLLSGGEKSLTAMALLMAIFQYTPSPFCILDEVDAPLDEANVERLTRLLREMAQETQFIVITHAKKTMEAAHALYGVTMQEPGVSKLVSVKFKPETESPKKITQIPLQEEPEPVPA